MSLLYEDNPTEYIVSSCGKFGTDEIIDELIRCKGCAYHGCYITKFSKLHPNKKYCAFFDIFTDDDGYCSWAERKDEEE